MAAMIIFIMMLWTVLQGFLSFSLSFFLAFFREFFITLMRYPHHFKVHSFTFDHFHEPSIPPTKKTVPTRPFRRPLSHHPPKLPGFPRCCCCQLLLYFAYWSELESPKNHGHFWMKQLGRGKTLPETKGRQPESLGLQDVTSWGLILAAAKSSFFREDIFLFQPAVKCEYTTSPKTKIDI